MFRYRSGVIILAPLLALLFTRCTSGPTESAKTKGNVYSVAKETDSIKDRPVFKLLGSASFNFGRIRAGDTIVHKFLFKNIGTNPLIIESALPSCGCTVAYFNRAPVLQNGTDSIVATFVSRKESLGFQNKVITVKCNSSETPFLLTIYGKVI